MPETIEPETIEDYYARVVAATDDEGRLAIPSDGIPYWDIFPFEVEGLTEGPCRARDTPGRLTGHGEPETLFGPLDLKTRT